jgi:hypothetical protein
MTLLFPIHLHVKSKILELLIVDPVGLFHLYNGVLFLKQLLYLFSDSRWCIFVVSQVRVAVKVSLNFVFLILLLYFLHINLRER